MFEVGTRYASTVRVCIIRTFVCLLPSVYLLHSLTWDILSPAALWYRQGYPSLLPHATNLVLKIRTGTTPVLYFYHSYIHTEHTPLASKEISQPSKIIVPFCNAFDFFFSFTAVCVFFFNHSLNHLEIYKCGYLKPFKKKSPFSLECLLLILISCTRFYDICCNDKGILCLSGHQEAVLCRKVYAESELFLHITAETKPLLFKQYDYLSHLKTESDFVFNFWNLSLEQNIINENSYWSEVCLVSQQICLIVMILGFGPFFALFLSFLLVIMN